MPAAAVIPAPIVYINAAAVKKLVVGSRRAGGGSFFDATAPVCPRVFAGGRGVLLIECPGGAGRFTLKKLECSGQA